jgi:linoleoyl-CoA desaturase
MRARPSFESSDKAFTLALRTKVDAFFANRSRFADGRMIAKTVFLLSVTALLWTGLVTGFISGLSGLPVAMLLGLFVAFIGFNVGHDGGHGSYSSNKFVNRAMAASFDLLGASSSNWARAHNVIHHTYTNVPGVDHDLNPGPFLVLAPRANPGFIYRLQHVFAFPLYAFTHLVWVFKKDFVQSADRQMTGKPPSAANIVGMVVGKLVHFGLFIAVPLVLGHWAWWQVLVGYVAMSAMTGFTLAVIFQLAHVVEGPAFPSVVDGQLAGGFASHQLRTTANFATDSALATFFLGGLNHQVEHHLLPGISHIHYAALAPLVKQTALEHGLPYLESGSFVQALASHVRTLRRLGRPAARTEGVPVSTPRTVGVVLPAPAH